MVEAKDIPVAGVGVRGKDFVEIWNSPEAPNINLKNPSSDSDFLKFNLGTFIARTSGENEAVVMANRTNRYVKADPDLTKPFFCGECHSPWFSQEAYDRHMRFAHVGTAPRARR